MAFWSGLASAYSRYLYIKHELYYMYVLGIDV